MTSHAKACNPRLLSRGHEGGALDVQVFPEVKQVLAEFKSKYNLSKLGAQGFCWGGKYTVLLLGMAQPCHRVPAGTSQHCIPDPLRPPKGSLIHPRTTSWALGAVSIWGLDPSVLTTTLSGLAGSPFRRKACFACLSFRSRCNRRELSAERGCLRPTAKL